jgi:hypothetical protein
VILSWQGFKVIMSLPHRESSAADQASRRAYAHTRVGCVCERG